MTSVTHVTIVEDILQHAWSDGAPLGVGPGGFFVRNHLMGVLTEVRAALKKHKSI